MSLNLPSLHPTQVSGPSVAQTAQVRLLVNNTAAPGAADLSDLLLLDNITGLAVRDSAGNKTSAGLQAFRRRFLQGGGNGAGQGGNGRPAEHGVAHRHALRHGTRVLPVSPPCGWAVRGGDHLPVSASDRLDLLLHLQREDLGKESLKYYIYSILFFKQYFY